MVVMLLALLLATLAIPCILMPEQVWRSFNAGDDDASYALHDYNLVAHRAYLLSQTRTEPDATLFCSCAGLWLIANRKPSARVWTTRMYGQAHHAAAQSTCQYPFPANSY